MEANAARLKDHLSGAIRPWLILLLVCAGFSLNYRFLHVFWTADYLPNVLQQAATNIIVAVGMTFVILTGGIDLSVGSVMALSGIALGLTVKQGPPAFLAYAMAFPVAVSAVAFALRVGSAKILAVIVGILIEIGIGHLIYRGATGGITLEGALVSALMVGCSCGLLNGLV